MKLSRVIISIVLLATLLFSISITGFADNNQFPVENAKKAIIVSFTNYSAEDVFTEDGNSYDTSKFHGYNYDGPFKQNITKDGTWSQTDENTWHVENIYLRLKGFDHATKLSCDVSFDGTNYTVKSVSYVTASSDYIDSNSSSKTSGIQTMEPNDFNSMLIIPSSYVTGDGGVNNSEELTYSPGYGYSDSYQKWLDKHFSWWDFENEKLSNIVKSKLGNPKSFKHVNTSYTGAVTEDYINRVNSVLEKIGSSVRVQENDVFISSTYSYKDASNKKVEKDAFAVLKYSDSSLELVGIG